MNKYIGEKISVCLLTYYHVKAIESTLQSILDQTITGYEVIVSDDCSTDGTWERILELAAKDARIQSIRTPHNMGMPGNANFAVSQSIRPYIALFHHDDLYRMVGLRERRIDGRANVRPGIIRGNNDRCQPFFSFHVSNNHSPANRHIRARNPPAYSAAPTLIFF